MMKQEECTTLFFDIRNFTTITQQYSDNDELYELISKVYETGIIFANKLANTNKVYINSTGDGFLCIFFGDKHYLCAYLMGIALFLKCKPLFDLFYDSIQQPRINPLNYYFGIGIESGYVRKVVGEIGSNKIETYIGNVINIAARLEALTKEHGRTGIVFGPEFNEKIINELQSISYNEIREKALKVEDRHSAKKIHLELDKITEDILTMYMFEHRLKGVVEPINTFRISKSLLETTNFQDWIYKERFPKYMYDNFLELIK